MGFLQIISIFVLFSVLLSAEAYTVNDTEKLHADLLTSYTAKLRPQSKTDVMIQFGLLHITELDIVTQRLHSVGFLIIDWKDNRLQWTASSYGNLTHTRTLFSEVWTPPIVLSNAADEIKLLNDNSDFASAPIMIHDEGNVFWMAPANFIAQCTINIQYYPFDSQSCKFVVSTWMYAVTELSLSSSILKVNLDLYEQHGEWEITDTSVANMTRDLNGYLLPSVKFTVHLKRKYSYYLMNMLLPVVVLAAMAPFVFVLPVESGEKIGFALTILLSLSVVMTIVSENIPPTSTHICVLSVYLLTTFIICSLETLLTVFTCKLHELHNKTYVMGSGCQKVARVLAKITRYRRRPKTDDVTTVKEDNIAQMMQEKVDLPKQIGRENSTWAENFSEDNHNEVGVKIEYNYEDMVLMYEKFNFIAFTLLTSLTTLIFMLTLQAGGGSNDTNTV